MPELEQIKTLVLAVLVLQILCVYWMYTDRQHKDKFYSGLRPTDLHSGRTSGARLRHQVLTTDIYGGINEKNDKLEKDILDELA